jgi:hypothetical protein
MVSVAGVHSHAVATSSVAYARERRCPALHTDGSAARGTDHAAGRQSSMMKVTIMLTL